MARTTITKTDWNEVTLRYADGEERVFYTNGRYVFERQRKPRNAGGDRQVCRELLLLGVTLTAQDGDELLAVVRRERKRSNDSDRRYQAAEARAMGW